MFEVLAEDAGARRGRLTNAHGVVETPTFMPVATKGSVKTLSNMELDELGVEAVICNAFLLYLRPGVEIIKEVGGIHKFMGWHGTIFTDSGGFQMLRGDFLVGTGKKGVTFRSPFDKSRHLFTPEKCMGVQNRLSSDVAMALDDLPPHGSDEKRITEAVKRTVEWAKRCKEAHANDSQLLFAIVQGGVDLSLREECTAKLVEMGFDGYGIGGLSIGEPWEESLEAIRQTRLPVESIRYLMGVGSPVEMLDAVELGVDFFDSSFPTRNARHNTVYTWRGKYDLSRAKYARDFGPLEESCGCQACSNYTRAYLHHLLKTHEALAMRMLTIHNLHMIQRLLRTTRERIAEGDFKMFKDEFVSNYSG